MPTVRSTANLAVAVIALCLLPAAASARPSADAAADGSAADRSRCVGADTPGGSSARRLHGMSCLLNAVRRAAGEPRLHDDRRLRRSAVAKAHDIVRCRKFAHDPCGEEWQAGMRRAGYARGRFRVGENLAWVSHGTPRTVLRLWLGSPAHRAHLLDRRYRDTGLARGTVRLPGVGVVEVWVQHFGARS
jgi:uncharacterized protein YkwD